MGVHQNCLDEDRNDSKINYCSWTEIGTKKTYLRIFWKCFWKTNFTKNDKKQEKNLDSPIQKCPFFADIPPSLLLSGHRLWVASYPISYTKPWCNCDPNYLYDPFFQAWDIFFNQIGNTIIRLVSDIVLILRVIRHRHIRLR